MKTNRLKYLIAYALRTKKDLILGFLLAACAVSTSLLGPAIIARILDRELVEGIGIRDPRRFLMLLVFYGAVMLFNALFHYGREVYFHRSAHKIGLFMQEDLFAHVQRLPIRYFDQLPAGKVVSRITNDTRDVKVLFQVVIVNVTTGLLYILGVYGTLLALDWRLALIALLPVPPALWLLHDYRKKSTQYNEIYRENLSHLNAQLNETIQGMEILQALGREDTIYHEFNEVSDEIYRQENNITKLESYSSFNAIGVLRNLILGLILIYFGLGHLKAYWPVSIGLLFIFISYMNTLFNQVQNILQRLGQLQRAVVASDQIFRLLQEEPLPESQRVDYPIRGQVNFEEVDFSYQEDDLVLSEVSFDLPAGQTMAFVGHTGSGKSTIMNLLLRFYDPNRGRILIDGKDLRDLPLKGYRDHLAIVLQDPWLFEGSILSNVSLGDERITEEIALNAFRELGGEEFLAKQPGGLHTPILEKGSNFSAGERQLISFARALAKNPAILVLDEATSNIDSETEKLIQQGIEKLKRGRTTLLIAHRLSTVRHAHEILVMDKGKVKERGNHQQLIEKGGIYYDMYRRQSESSYAM